MSAARKKAVRPRKPVPMNERMSYSVDDAAAVIGVSRATIWRLVKGHELTTFKLGARTLILAGVIDQFLQRKAAA